MSTTTARPSAWRRLSDRLEANADGLGPLRGSLTWRRIAMIWLASNFVVTTMLTGTIFVPGVGYGEALMLILVGSIIGGAVLVTVGAIGTRARASPQCRSLAVRSAHAVRFFPSPLTC